MRELRDKLYSTTGLENLTENLVFQELYNFSHKMKTSTKPQFCVCDICLADVAAIVLNELKPYYCSNFIDKDKHKNYYEKNKEEVQRKIIKAFDIVKKNPHHGKD